MIGPGVSGGCAHDWPACFDILKEIFETQIREKGILCVTSNQSISLEVTLPNKQNSRDRTKGPSQTDLETLACVSESEIRSEVR
jgi:hypothetical protein